MRSFTSWAVSVMPRVPMHVLNYKAVSRQSTYGGLSACAFAQFVKINEKFFNSNSVLNRTCLNALFDVSVDA